VKFKNEMDETDKHEWESLKINTYLDRNHGENTT
jgi:hypothetical protein